MGVEHIENVYIDYELAIYDHFPLCFHYKFSFMQNPFPREVISTDEFVDWNRINKPMENAIKQDLDTYILVNGLLVNDLFYCFNVNCKDPLHKHQIDVLLKKLNLCSQRVQRSIGLL